MKTTQIFDTDWRLDVVVYVCCETLSVKTLGCGWTGIFSGKSHVINHANETQSAADADVFLTDGCDVSLLKVDSHRHQPQTAIKKKDTIN